MILASLLLALPLGAALPLEDGDPPLEVRTRLFAEPVAVEVGEPFEVILEVTRDADVPSDQVGGGELLLDDSWVLFDTRYEPPAPPSDEAERLLTRRIWSLASLDPGARTLVVQGLLPPEATSGIETCTVQVAGVLADGEEEPRPLRGLPADFGAEPAEAPFLSRTTILVMALTLFSLLLAAFLFALFLLRRSRGQSGPAGVTPRERLARLAAETDSDLSRTRERTYELSHLVREAVEARIGRDLRGRTDEEWTAALVHERGVSGEEREAIGALVTDCARVKYAGEVPSAWAIEDLFTRARAALESLERPSDPREDPRREEVTT